MKKSTENFSPWHVGVAAEAIAAGQFARLGYDVSVQYGANQPEYDLIISKGKDSQPIKISVKGSKEGAWGLTQGFLEKTKDTTKKRTSEDYQQAITNWLDRHGSKTIICFVQFKSVDIHELPRIYLASPTQVAEQLKKVAKGKGGTILYEKHAWSKKNSVGLGTEEKIPDGWKFSDSRLKEVVSNIGFWASVQPPILVLLQA